MKRVNFDRYQKRHERHRAIYHRIKTGNHHIRVLVLKTNMHLYAHVIDDKIPKMLFSVSTLQLKLSGNNITSATQVGVALAEKLLSYNIKTVVFDRGGFKYHGKVAAVAQALRQAQINV